MNFWLFIISPATVERWYQNHCRLRRSEMANRPCPKVLGIEEHFFTRKRGYATMLVDLKRKKSGYGRPSPELSIYTQIAYIYHVRAVFKELVSFETHRREYLSDDEFRALQQVLMANPQAGRVI